MTWIVTNLLQGTREVTVNIPCGIKIKTKTVDLCQTVRGAMGNAGQELITKTGAMCTCLPQFLDLMGKDTFKAATSGTDVSAAMSSMISDLMKAQKVQRT